MTQSDKDPQVARLAIDDAISHARKAAQRMPADAGWFELIWAGFIGGLVISMVLPMPYGLIVLALLLLGFGKACSVYENRYGVWASGFRAGNTRAIAIVLSIFVLGILFTVHFLRQTQGLVWPGLVGAPLAMAISFIGGRLWVRSFRSGGSNL